MTRRGSVESASTEVATTTLHNRAMLGDRHKLQKDEREDKLLEEEDARQKQEMKDR